jgi:nitroimidazol reductase NimA-like FMN-containing flavoprotein (pyridoxamine 5'-phosphate oxidase superfamily)
VTRSKPADGGLPQPGSTPRTQLRRIPERAVHDRGALDAVLDAGLVAHVAVTEDDGQPFIVPVAYGRDGDRVLFHGSTGSRLFRGLAAGQPTCLTVTLLDGLVLARSLFESSMNYRGAMVLGRCAELTGDDKVHALKVISDHLLPGRWDEARQPSKKELAATIVLALSLTEASVKIRDGGPEDPPEDVAIPIWAGEIPITHSFGAPIPADDLTGPYPLPDYVSGWKP